MEYHDLENFQFLCIGILSTSMPDVTHTKSCVRMVEAISVVGNVFSIYKVLYNDCVTMYDSIGTFGQIPNYCEFFTITTRCR